MFPIKTIFFPTDQTTASAGAWQMAQKLAQDHVSKVIVAHVIPYPQAAAYAEVDVSLLTPVVSHEEILQQLRKDYPGQSNVPVEYTVADGDASEVIVRLAKEHQADMIVMGTHGRKGIGRFVLGSVAEHIVRRASCPVVTVKGDWAPALPAMSGSSCD